MIARIVNGLAALGGALSAAQFPAFYQQYLQRLGGRLDQAENDVSRLLADAARLGRGLDAYIRELMDSGTEAAREAAQRELERVDNASELAQSYHHLASAPPLERPVVFARNFDPAIARDTIEAFQPALPLTPEAFVYGALGMLAALGLLVGTEVCGRRVLRHFKRQPAA